MPSETLPERVVFEFADHQLEGTVVDATTHAGFNQSIQTIFTIDRDGSQYTVPESHATPV